MMSSLAFIMKKFIIENSNLLFSFAMFIVYGIEVSKEC